MFKVGDKVRCLTPFEGFSGKHVLLKNRAYRISHATMNSVLVEGDDWGWFSHRFEKIVPNGRKL